MPVTRRSFLQRTAVSASTAALAATSLNAQGANERLNIGLIGTGGRCRHLMQALARIPSVRMMAICDVYGPNLEQARRLVEATAFATRDYRELLARNDVQAVVIATPDHWHAPLTIAACNAGKDVYVEKPLTHNYAEGQAVIDAQNRNRRIVQVGTQQRSMPQFIRGKELIREGRLGRIHKIHLTWNRNSDRVRRGPQGVQQEQLDWRAFLGSARMQPFDEYRYRNWRWFWDFGNGILGDLMVHFIDAAHMLMDLDHPELATTIGGNYISRDVWETPDTIQTMMVYPNDLQVYFEGTFCNARNAAMLEFMGTDATLYLDRGRFELYPERNRGTYQESVLGLGTRGRDFYERPDGEVLHLTNWIECIRSRARPNCPAEAGVSAANAAHLGNRALRSGQVARWAQLAEAAPGNR